MDEKTIRTSKVCETIGLFKNPDRIEVLKAVGANAGITFGEIRGASELETGAVNHALISLIGHYMITARGNQKLKKYSITRHGMSVLLLLNNEHFQAIAKTQEMLEEALGQPPETGIIR